ncbi:MAG: PorT family protein [Bacteroidetes bacterium]|nr:PorT family protein [Bacteroidota bacterium]MBS1631770.1 PorT family protein [Bacteroidota bacterium]
MKKTIISVIIAALCFKAQSQNTSLGVFAGVSIANMHSKVDGETDNGKSKIGVLAGLVLDIPIDEQFSFQPGLQFVQKGTKEEETSGGFTEKVKLGINYFEIPLNFLYHPKKGNGFFIGAGPSVGIGISGKGTYSYDDASISSDLQFGNTDDDDIRRLDMGANFITGITFQNGLSLSANYTQGLSNIFPGGSSDGTLKNRYFGIRLGYFIKGNKK